MNGGDDMGENINVRYISLPSRVHGVSVRNDDDSYTVFLDPADSADRQQTAYRHEIEHILNGDFDDIDTKFADSIEVEAHGR